MTDYIGHCGMNENYRLENAVVLDSIACSGYSM